MIPLLITTYIITITLLAWWMDRPKPDVIKKNGIWVYGRVIKAGECWQEIPFAPDSCVTFSAHGLQVGDMIINTTKEHWFKRFISWLTFWKKEPARTITSINSDTSFTYEVKR